LAQLAMPGAPSPAKPAAKSAKPGGPESGGTSCRAALAALQRDLALESLHHVDLCGRCPPIDKMDGLGSGLTACRRLSLSSNAIERIGSLAGLPSLEILSLGRNRLKRLEGLEPVAGTLKELWVSYNQLDRLAGVERCTALRVLYLSNNKIKEWGEVDRLAALPALEELLLAGNPFWTEARETLGVAGYRAEVLRRLPGLKKLDGIVVEEEEREAAAGGVGEVTRK
jgi:dynein light chain 1, axonemal